jgi:hypothetical protein
MQLKLNSPVYNPERELMEVQHFLQASSLIIGKNALSLFSVGSLGVRQ